MENISSSVTVKDILDNIRATGIIPAEFADCFCKDGEAINVDLDLLEGLLRARAARAIGQPC